MSIKHMNKCLTSSAIKEIVIKMTLRFHLTPVRMAVIKKTINDGKNVGERNSFIPLVGI
jgi:hypothetical protein